jgi:chromosome segregation ATPase
MDIPECDEISSILLESESNSGDLPQKSILSNELSSISNLSFDAPCKISMNNDQTDTDVKALRKKLQENVHILHEELRLYEEANKKENSIRREAVNTEDVIEQLNSIRSCVNDLKHKLKGSEELISEKTRENVLLKEQLKDLEIRSLTSEDKFVSCRNCVVF